MEHHSITLHGSALGGVAPFQPGLHLRVLVGAVVVHDQMQRHVVRHLAVDGLQERQPLAMSMLGRRQAEDLAIEVAEGREESDGPMAVVVVGSGADVADAERQPRLRSLESLALALLVAAKDQGSIRWIEVEADDVPELRLELGVLGDLERPCNVRLDVVAGPDPLDRSLGDPHSIGHGAHRPPPPSRGRRRRPSDDPLAHLRRNRRLAPPTRCICQASQAFLAEAFLPQSDDWAVDPDLTGRLLLAQASGTSQDDPSPAHLALSRGRACQDAFELQALFRRDGEGPNASCHAAMVAPLNRYV